MTPDQIAEYLEHNGASDDEIDDFLEHFGVKGMRWGVRRADKNWIASKFDASNMANTMNEAARRANKEVVRINNKPQYKDVNFNKPSTLRSKYYEEHRAAYEKILNEVAQETGATSPSGRYSLKISAASQESGVSFPVFTVIDNTVASHASEPGVLKLVVIFNSMGHIVSFKGAEVPDLEHFNIKKTHKKGATMTPDQIGEYLEHNGATDEEIDDFLEHFGVKGMQWGVRRAEKRAAKREAKQERKDAREAARQAHNASIQKSRDYFDSGKADTDLAKAREKYIRDSARIGKTEAAKALRAAEDKYNREGDFAMAAKQGKHDLAIALGLVGLYSVGVIGLLASSGA